MVGLRGWVGLRGDGADEAELRIESDGGDKGGLSRSLAQSSGESPRRASEEAGIQEGIISLSVTTTRENI